MNLQHLKESGDATYTQDVRQMVSILSSTQPMKEIKDKMYSVKIEDVIKNHG